jgi:hypothetical protein
MLIYDKVNIDADAEVPVFISNKLTVGEQFITSVAVKIKVKHVN